MRKQPDTFCLTLAILKSRSALLLENGVSARLVKRRTFPLWAARRSRRLDEAGNLVEGLHFDGVWRWTKGHLEMAVRDDRSYRINWRDLAPPPKMWSRFSRDVGGW